MQRQGGLIGGFSCFEQSVTVCLCMQRWALQGLLHPAPGLLSCWVASPAVVSCFEGPLVGLGEPDATTLQGVRWGGGGLEAD